MIKITLEIRNKKNKSIHTFESPLDIEEVLKNRDSIVDLGRDLSEFFCKTDLSMTCILNEYEDEK